MSAGTVRPSDGRAAVCRGAAGSGGALRAVSAGTVRPSGGRAAVCRGAAGSGVALWSVSAVRRAVVYDCCLLVSTHCSFHLHTECEVLYKACVYVTLGIVYVY